MIDHCLKASFIKIIKIVTLPYTQKCRTSESFNCKRLTTLLKTFHGPICLSKSQSPHNTHPLQPREGPKAEPPQSHSLPPFLPSSQVTVTLGNRPTDTIDNGVPTQTRPSPYSVILLIFSCNIHYNIS